MCVLMGEEKNINEHNKSKSMALNALVLVRRNYFEKGTAKIKNVNLIFCTKVKHTNLEIKNCTSVESDNIQRGQVDHN